MSVMSQRSEFAGGVMHLFLDTNIYLSFYHYTSDDLEELRKLGVLIESKNLTLHVPDQVVFEFRRNREAKFADALSKFKKEGLDKNFPQIMLAYEEDYRVMRDSIKSLQEGEEPDPGQAGGGLPGVQAQGGRHHPRPVREGWRREGE